MWLAYEYVTTRILLPSSCPVWVSVSGEVKSVAKCGHSFCDWTTSYCCVCASSIVLTFCPDIGKPRFESRFPPSCNFRFAKCRRQNVSLKLRFYNFRSVVVISVANTPLQIFLFLSRCAIITYTTLEHKRVFLILTQTQWNTKYGCQHTYSHTPTNNQIQSQFPSFSLCLAEPQMPFTLTLTDTHTHSWRFLFWLFRETPEEVLWRALILLWPAHVAIRTG